MFQILALALPGLLIAYGLGALIEDNATDRSDDFTGTDGDDMIDAGNGDDLLSGLDGDDILIGGSGDDGLSGGDGDDILLGQQDEDVLRGDAGLDSLSGGSGDDILFGGAGADTLSGGAGRDRAQYSDAATGLTADLQAQGNNTGDAAGDVYSSIERLLGSTFDDVLRGDAAQNFLWGQNGNDAVIGRGGNDWLYGQNGNDRLVGGAGDDRLIGGAGADVFAFTANGGYDRVFDFGADDRLRFAIQGLDRNDLTITDATAGAVIDYGSGSVLLKGVASSSLMEDDFSFL